MPWIALPAINVAQLSAPPKMPLPRVKRATIARMMYRLPQMLASCPKS
jgi:hypothetical protein